MCHKHNVYSIQYIYRNNQCLDNRYIIKIRKISNIRTIYIHNYNIYIIHIQMIYIWIIDVGLECSNNQSLDESG